MTKETINIVDVSEIENDGAFGAFVVTLEMGGKYSPVLICYSLETNTAVATASTLPQDVADELVKNDELVSEMREAVMAERDSQDEARKDAERLAKRSEAQKAQSEEAIKKWSLN